MSTSAVPSLVRAASHMTIPSPAGTGGQWHPVGGGVHKEVAAIAMSGTHVYVGGLFTDAGGNPHADHIACVMLITKGYLPLITR